MKRSGREGGWPDIPSSRVRFGLEAGFLVLVAVGAALAELGPLTIVGLMGAAWVIVALIERAVSQERSEEQLAAGQQPEPEPEPEPAPSPTAGLEERPSRSHVRRLEPEPPAPEPEPPSAPEEPEPEPEPERVPGPSVSERLPALPGLDSQPEPEPIAAQSEREPEPVPEPPAPPPLVPPPRPSRIWRRAEAPIPPPEPSAVPPPPPPPRPPAPPQEWNLWDLERRARERAGDNARDEEWAALLMHLREFANADGVLPTQFDSLVRESFAELIEVG
jgi:hypothetical protein